MIQATYGHGTHNDFVLVFDEENKLTFSADQIKRICDRKDGIGSDGFIKIVKKDIYWIYLKVNHYYQLKIDWI
jgi:diaminopimelate epimerase